ncbi:MAG: magnesium transporter [Syntrophales bacterium]|jgi:magnesium transporter|nr:magnesium transporter [Syntrophales bacterium]MCK9528819.1 magnesium transporter [Syntrophales bacterium]MDX9921981.1 magnesium transporter [Syntrophales bacterium]
MPDTILNELKELLEAALAGDDASHDALTEQLEAYLEAGDRESLRDFFASVHPADAAHIFESYSPERACAFLRILDITSQVEIFNYIPARFEARMATTMSRHELAAIIGAMSHDERADLFNRLTPEQRDDILPALAQVEREDIHKLASYPEGTAGAVMTSDYCTLEPDLTAAGALDKLRREAPDKETIYHSYVIDTDRKLLGVVSLRDLVMASPGAPVKDIMISEPIFGRATDNDEDTADIMAKYDLIAMPILNGDDRLVGIVTFDDVQDIIEEEATEDFHRMGSISGIGEKLTETSFMEAGSWLLIQKRFPWLLALVFVNLLSGAGIAYFEDTIRAVVALVFFMPLLIASGGNAGAQSATLMVRALATGDVKTKDWVTLLGREVGIALLLGLGMALAVSFVGVFRSGPEVALVVALTMMAVVLFGSLVGCLLPCLLTRFNIDPATASVPLITSIADVGGIIIYFNIATRLLKMHGIL